MFWHPPHISLQMQYPPVKKSLHIFYTSPDVYLDWNSSDLSRKAPNPPSRPTPRYALEHATFNFNHMFPPNWNIFLASHIHPIWHVKHIKAALRTSKRSQMRSTTGGYTLLKPNRYAYAPTLSLATSKFSHLKHTIFWLLLLPVIFTCAHSCPASCLVFDSISCQWNTTAPLR